MFRSTQGSIKRFLRWSERYTKTDMVYLASGGFWLTVGQFCVSLSALALSVIMARYLTKDNYGTYKYVLSVIALLSTFSLSGLSTAVFQSAARGFDGALSESFWMNLRWSVFMFASALVLALYYYLHGNLLLAVGLLAGGCLSPIITSANLYTSFLPGKKDFRRQALFGGVWGTVLPTAVLIATAILTRSPLWVTLAYFASNGAVALYFYNLTLRTYRPDPALKDAEMLSYSKHLSLIGILNGVAGNLDNILIFHYVGAPALAVYAFATGIVDQAKGPLKSLDNMMQARFVAHKHEAIRESLGNKMLLLLVAAVISIVVYIALAPFLYSLLFPAYFDAVPYSQVYALSLLVMVFWPAGSYVQAKKMLRVQYAATVINSVMQIAAFAIGVIGWGLWGLIVARVLTRILGSGIYHVLALWEEPVTSL